MREKRDNDFSLTSKFFLEGRAFAGVQLADATITWDIVVGGWDLEYTAEFVPSAEGSYTIQVEKPRKVMPSEEAIHSSFTPSEAGKMVFSVDNSGSRRKKVAAYRYIVCKSAPV
ncbi:hypothetical protein C1H46_037626 [Malus baccata]|uniref:GOLD domain-containing protein n=1 Tax=Malus baccata TaxID=106549 RepID=A0A540KRJ0_MALBA|nr:hypothetical protein C1H46_037626 [Malus baccata]